MKDHHLFLGKSISFLSPLSAWWIPSTAEWKNAYPEARLIGPAAVANKKRDLEFHGVYGKDSEGTLYGYEDEVRNNIY